ncbi:MAG: DUF2905 domain-containing protein [Thermodesulfobacteriota bacterium]|jgi:hypothetical protein|nr:DUF2905 domain-containing protein [Candidatus Dadabacteria bacterium]|tara:strand:+ start:3985 stop:4200 length:216 start_codon:yes stop_codon:yes gene_type:complete
MSIGKIIFFSGFLLIVIGALIHFTGVSNIFKDNPLDLKFTFKNTTFYFPIGTSIILSVMISFIIYIFKKVL